MLGMLRAARQKLSSSSAPSMMSALENPSLPKRVCSALVFPASRLACSITTMSPSLAFAEIASLSSTEPAALPSRVVTLSSMSRPLAARFGRRSRRRGRGFRRSETERAGLRRFLRQALLHRVAHRDPAALGARNRALDQDQAALDVGLHHLEIERGDPLDAEMARHLLVLEGLARILTAAGRAVRAMRDRDAVRGAQAGEIPALHRAGKSLADRGAGHIDILADHEMIGGDLGADRDQALLADAEFGELALGLDLGDREMPALGLAHVLDLAAAGSELERDVSALLLGTVRDDLAVRKPEHRDRDVLAGLGEHPGHSHLLCDHSGTHRLLPRLANPNGSELDLD